MIKYTDPVTFEQIADRLTDDLSEAAVYAFADRQALQMFIEGKRTDDLMFVFRSSFRPYLTLRASWCKAAIEQIHAVRKNVFAVLLRENTEAEQEAAE